jgi:hypothetical protein
MNLVSSDLRAHCSLAHRSLVGQVDRPCANPNAPSLFSVIKRLRVLAVPGLKKNAPEKSDIFLRRHIGVGQGFEVR